MVYCKTFTMCLVISLFLLPAPAWAHYHLGWIVNEVYTDASGTNQFVELFNPSDNGQHVFNSNGTSGPASLFSSVAGNEFVFPSDLPSSLTSGKYALIGTPGFANLAGAPSLDYTLPSNFFDITGDTIIFGDDSFFFTVDEVTFGALPTNGIDSVSDDGTTVTVNSPTNFVGQTGSVPEPTTLSLLALGGIALCRRSRVRRPSAHRC